MAPAVAFDLPETSALRIDSAQLPLLIKHLRAESAPNSDTLLAMSTHEKVNQRYSQIQSLLRERLGAEGRGVFEMFRSVESRISSTLGWELRAIAHIRNQVVHEALAVPTYFEPLCKAAIAALKSFKAPRVAKGKPKPAEPHASKSHPSKVPTAPPQTARAKAAKPIATKPRPRKLQETKPRSLKRRANKR